MIVINLDVTHWELIREGDAREGDAPAESFHEGAQAHSLTGQSEFAAGKGSAGASPSRLQTCKFIQLQRVEVLQ